MNSVDIRWIQSDQWSFGLNLRHWCRLQDPLDNSWPVLGGNTFKNHILKAFSNQQHWVWVRLSVSPGNGHQSVHPGICTCLPPWMKSHHLPTFLHVSVPTLKSSPAHPLTFILNISLSLCVLFPSVCAADYLFSCTVMLDTDYLHTPPLRQGTTHLLNSHRAP